MAAPGREELHQDDHIGVQNLAQKLLTQHSNRREGGEKEIEKLRFKSKEERRGLRDQLGFEVEVTVS